ncbi:hypothetical protein FMK81_13425 [Klebsiella oxytoca]|uniref:hypothetical protein n=1 Tax=Klebsiella oxytoca TaxID=571 RepID=UPI001CCFDEA2|nr:hypothetical protein [Klebsiella oxytoca]MBZ7262506.1 hypothetical protein [Klebsiella oxytoca]
MSIKKHTFSSSKKAKTVCKTFTWLITGLYFIYLIGSIFVDNRLPIRFVLPIIYGLSLAVHTYKTHKAILKYGSDCALFFVAAITSAYLVINTTNEKVDFFDNYMKNVIGFLITNSFAVAAAIRFYISLVDLLKVYNWFKK